MNAPEVGDLVRMLGHTGVYHRNELVGTVGLISRFVDDRVAKISTPDGVAYWPIEHLELDSTKEKTGAEEDRMKSKPSSMKRAEDYDDDEDDDEDDDDEEEDMSERTTDHLKDTSTMMVRATREGISQAASQKAAKVMVKIARKRLGKNYPAMLKTPLGQKAEPLIVAATVHMLCGMYPNKIPQAANLRANCERVVVAEMRDNGAELLETFIPALEELSNAVPELAGTNDEG